MKNELEQRTFQFSLEVVKFVSELPFNTVTSVLGKQLLRCATSIGANYREANRASSKKDFLYRIEITEREASETEYWLELCLHASVGDANKLAKLIDESRELIAIFTSIGKKTKLSM